MKSLALVSLLVLIAHAVNTDRILFWRNPLENFVEHDIYRIRHRLPEVKNMELSSSQLFWAMNNPDLKYNPHDRIFYFRLKCDDQLWMKDFQLCAYPLYDN